MVSAPSISAIVAVAGIEDIRIGETIADRETPRALPAIRVDEPTIAMIIGVNTSPCSGREGDANLYPEASQLKHDPGNSFSVPYTWGTSGLCYREDLTGYDPDSWNDLLKPRDNVSGKTTMLATERWLMLPAQKALGFSVNTTSEEEMTQVKEQLLETKPTLLAFDDTTFYARLVSGEASLVMAWDGWCNFGIAEDDGIKWVVPKEGSDLWADTMVILKTSKSKEAAHAFINNVLDPANHKWVTEQYFYKIPNKAAMEALDPSIVEAYPNVGMSPADLLKGEQFLDLGDAGPMYTEIATEVAAQ